MRKVAVSKGCQSGDVRAESVSRPDESVASMIDRLLQSDMTWEDHAIFALGILMQSVESKARRISVVYTNCKSFQVSAFDSSGDKVKLDQEHGLVLGIILTGLLSAQKAVEGCHGEFEIDVAGRRLTQHHYQEWEGW